MQYKMLVVSAFKDLIPKIGIAKKHFFWGEKAIIKEKYLILIFLAFLKTF